MRRLLTLHEAYGMAGQADELLAEGRPEEATALYRRAAETVPDSHELRFWAGLGAFQGGDTERGMEDVRAAIAAHADWRLMLERLPAALAPSGPEVLDRLTRTQM